MGPVHGCGPYNVPDSGSNVAKDVLDLARILGNVRIVTGLDNMRLERHRQQDIDVANSSP